MPGGRARQGGVGGVVHGMQGGPRKRQSSRADDGRAARGSENQGLARSLIDATEGVISIGGSGSVERLNVACATTAVLGEYWRQHRVN